MKKHISRLFVTLALTLFVSFAAFSGPPLPPGHGEPDDVKPTPIGAGLIILISLAGVYGAKRVYDARKKLQE